MSFRRFKKTLIISVLFIFTIAFLIYWLYPDADPRPVCNLNEYTVITESGRDGVGTLEITVDYETILSEYKDYINEDGMKDVPEWLRNGVADGSAISAINALFYGVPLDEALRTKTFDLVLSRDSKLENGDVVTVQWTDSPTKREALNKIFNVQFEYEDFTYTMKNLY